MSLSTWRHLGLSVAVGYAVLGTFAITQPTSAAVQFGLLSPPTNVGAADKSLTSVIEATETEHKNSMATSMVLLGVRDLSIGVALLTFYRFQANKAMGTLIMSGMILCTTDAYYIWKLRGKGRGAAVSAGASIWAVIGLGLLEYI